MDCASQTEFGSPTYIEGVFGRARLQRLPVSGAFDLTYRCNFRCTHCYVGHLVAQKRSQAGELETGQIVDLLSEAAEAGCLLLLVSGGEPLMREDFVEIYVAARRLGMIVTVFTNASLVRQEHLDAFSEYPPHQVEVSVYGASEAVYERVTGVAGSFGRARAGIERLLDRGLRVDLKSVILQENVADVAAVAAFARDLGVRFRVDPLLTARLNGDKSPLGQRVDPQLAADIEMDVGQLRTQTAKLLEQLAADDNRENVPADRFYRCGAGRASFHIDPQGFMHPCVMSPGIAYSTLIMGFDDAWKAVTEAVDRATWDEAGRCADCPTVTLCGYCPGLFLLEQSSPSQPPEYLCRLGESRLRAIDLDKPGVGDVRAN